MMEPAPLSDDDYLRFLDEGYLVLTPTALGADDHHRLYRQADELYATADASGSATTHLSYLGDNLRAQCPAIDGVLDDPVIAGALERILGPDPLLHPHSFCHRSSEKDQLFHQDGNLPWNERGHYRSHLGDWAMLFYYPQAVDLTNGPTEVVVGSHYWTIDHETEDRWHPGDRVDRTVAAGEMGQPDLARRDERQRQALDRGLGFELGDGDRRFVTVPAGSVVLAHYDLFHRGSRTAGAQDARYLYKFYFARLHRPPAAREGSSGAVPSPLDPRRAPMVTAAWRWNLGLQPVADDGPDGKPVPSHVPAPALADIDREDKRVIAAYERAGAGSLPALADDLHGPTEGGRRAASHALRALGGRGVGPLLVALGSGRAPVRRAAAAGLASHLASGDETVEALITAGRADDDDLVRSLATYALGLVARADGADGVRIGRALLARLRPGAEADNAHGAGFSRSIVRQEAALALVQTAANHPLPGDLIDTLVEILAVESDRYVHGLLIEAVIRADELGPQSRRRLLSHLAARRWSPAPQQDTG